MNNKLRNKKLSEDLLEKVNGGAGGGKPSFGTNNGEKCGCEKGTPHNDIPDITWR